MQNRLPPLLFFCIPIWSSWRPPRSRQTDDLCYPDPPHRSFFSRAHSFLSIFSRFSVSPILWLATFVSIVSHFEFVCTPPHVCRHPSSSHPSLCLLTRPAGVFLGFGRSNNGSWIWLVPSLDQPPCGSFLYDGRALCPLSVSSCPCSAYLVDGRSSTQSSFCKLVV